MKTRTFRVYGANGHRQKESFSPSYDFTTLDNKATFQVVNADITGTNDYTKVIITAENDEQIIDRLFAQISDGIFENSKCGDIFEEVAGDILEEIDELAELAGW